MITIEKAEIYGWEAAIRGMRNSYNSWNRSDSMFSPDIKNYKVGEADLELMRKLSRSGDSHGKFMRFITVSVDITAPRYWWAEMDTYKVGTARNSCSTMHKVAEKEFTIADFSHEHLMQSSLTCLNNLIAELNKWRANYLQSKSKDDWWQMIQLLPASYQQRSTIQLNYQVLRNIYHTRKNHRLDEWKAVCKWIETLPYSELITQN